MLVSLKRRGSSLSHASEQLAALNEATPVVRQLPKFFSRVGEPITPLPLEIFQVNLGKMCNQACKHCHVDAGPDRTEIMTRETMEQCLEIMRRYPIQTVDLTGGAPELNPHFRWFVEQLSELGRDRPGFRLIDRCNLTIILANETFRSLPQFYAKHRMNVVSSLPHFTQRLTDRQRGEGVFERSIAALHMLNEAGYGQPGTGLVLDLVFNPSGAFLPASQTQLEEEFRIKLRSEHGIEFNNLFALTNLPISRFLEFLLDSGNLDDYMQRLVQAFNPRAVAGLMCRNTISVGWDGLLYDCDFNQMLEIPVEGEMSVESFDWERLHRRSIRVNQHCYGCTAGSGSSCGGAVVS